MYSINLNELISFAFVKKQNYTSTQSEFVPSALKKVVIVMFVTN